MADSESCHLSFNDSKNLRAVSDIVIKTLSIHIASVSLFGHHMSLCRIPSTRLAVCMLLGFAVAPISVLALFICRVVKLLYCRRPGATWQYRLSACCGVWASLEDPTESASKNRTIPLYYIAPRDVESKKQKYDQKWTGSIFLLLVGWVQASLTSFLYFRRLHTNACSYLDIVNGTLALGSFLTQTFSLIIILLNTKW
ncbi:hypothetical protein CLAIMM_08018 isoform 1, partial [Cladophialophora immunda]